MSVVNANESMNTQLIYCAYKKELVYYLQADLQTQHKIISIQYPFCQYKET